MKKILTLGASNSSTSINQQFATYVAQQIDDAVVTVLDLNDFEMPIYGVDRERAEGIPAKAQEFIDIIAEHDAVVVSFAEHNGSYTAAFKNVSDWASRVRKDVWQNRPFFALSTAPGPRGGINVMGNVRQYLPRMGANIVAYFSLPKFREYFSKTEGITNLELSTSFKEQLVLFKESILQEA